MHQFSRIGFISRKTVDSNQCTLVTANSELTFQLTFCSFPRMKMRWVNRMKIERVQEIPEKYACYEINLHKSNIAIDEKIIGKYFSCTLLCTTSLLCQHIYSSSQNILMGSSIEEVNAEGCLRKNCLKVTHIWMNKKKCWMMTKMMMSKY